MRVSVGVTYSTASGKYTIYSEEMVDDLILQLRQADLVVGYNHEHFDYGVLQRYTMWNMIDITNNLDLCKDIEQRGGVRVKLDSVAAASIGSSKTAVGTQALKWWAEYVQTGNTDLLMDIARYCCFDVKVTRDVHWYGAEHGFIRYDDKNLSDRYSGRCRAEYPPPHPSPSRLSVSGENRFFRCGRNLVFGK